MKFAPVVCGVVVALFSPPGVLTQGTHARAKAQTAVAPSNSGLFEPLVRWRAAVMARDRAALAALYTTNPPAQAKTPEGKTNDPTEEPRFWLMLSANGLSRLTPKILQIERPQPGLAALTLRIEMEFSTSSGRKPFVISIGQYWVQQGGTWRIFSTNREAMVANPPLRLPQPAKPNVDLYPPPGEARSEIAAALRSAARDHKRVILVFGGNWCYDCHVLDTAFHSKQIAPFLDANFHVVHVNIGDGDKNLELADEYGVPLRKAVRVPSLAVLDAGGKVVYSQQNGQFDDSTRLAPADIILFLKKWAPHA
jgi:Thioredoxin-like